MSSDVGVVKWVACSGGVQGDGVCRMLLLPVADYSLCTASIEESDEVVVCGAEGDVKWKVGEVVTKVVPKLWYGKLAWMLRVEVLEHGVEGSAGDAEEIACRGVIVKSQVGCKLVEGFEEEKTEKSCN